MLGLIGVLAFSLSLPATKAAVPAFGPIIPSLGRAEIAALQKKLQEALVKKNDESAAKAKKRDGDS